MSVREATGDDLGALCAIFERMGRETELPLTYDPGVARHQIWAAIHDPAAAVLLFESDGVIGGVLLGTFQHEFSTELCAFVSKLYVEREFRGLGVTPALIERFHEHSENMGARVCFAASTAGMGEKNERLYANGFIRQGYENLGRVLVRELNHG